MTLTDENYWEILLYKDKIDEIVQGLKAVTEMFGGDNLLNLLTLYIKIQEGEAPVATNLNSLRQ